MIHKTDILKNINIIIQNIKAIHVIHKPNSLIKDTNKKIQEVINYLKDNGLADPYKDNPLPMIKAYQLMLKIKQDINFANDKMSHIIKSLIICKNNLKLIPA